MTVTDEVATFIGHRLHLVRSREVPRLIEWLGPNLADARILDVAGGDGFWGSTLVSKGASVTSIDIARHKLVRGRRLRFAPALVEGDALVLPFRDASFDALMSVCALEHFDDPLTALREMARVLRDDGVLVMSVDALTREDRYPQLAAHHRRRYHVNQTFRREALAADLASVGFTVTEATYLFRGSNEALYLGASRLRPNWSWNALVPLAPMTAVLDRMQRDDSGAILLIRAVKAAPTSH